MLNRFQWIIQFSYGVAAMQKSSKDQDTENAGCCPTEVFGCLLSLILFRFVQFHRCGLLLRSDDELCFSVTMLGWRAEC